MILRFIKSVLFFINVWLVTFRYAFLLIMFWWKAGKEGRKISEQEAHHIATLWGQALLKSVPGWKIQVEGLQNIPEEGRPYVIVANHESSTDILAIYFLGLQFRWLSKDSMFRIPVVGLAMRWAGYVSINRGDKGSHQKALQKSAEHVRNGVPMLYFPEGTRSVRGAPGDFKTGAFRLAQSCGAPVLPVVLHGAGHLLKRRSLCPSPATVRIRVLPLVYQKDGESVQAFTLRVREKICGEHKQLVSEYGNRAGKDKAEGYQSAETVC